MFDNTTSLRYGSIGDVTQDVVDRSKSFVENFHESFDRISLVKFAFRAQVPVAFTDDRGHSRSDITTAIDAFSFGSFWNAQYTNASEGMYRALDEMRNVSNPANLKVIVFFSDGAPNTFASHFEFTDGNVHAGAIRTNDESSGTPYGLWRHDSISTKLSGDGYAGSSIYTDLEELPDHYNLHDEDEAEFKVLNPSHSVRSVTQYTTNSTSQLFTKVNRVARNLVEDMAEAARQEGTYVFTLGLDSSLTSTSGPDSEYGEDLLLRMANDPAMLDDTDLAGDYKSDQLEGVYCHAC